MTDRPIGPRTPGVAFPGQVVDRRPIDRLLAAADGHPLVKLLRAYVGADDLARADFADTRVAQPLTYVAGLLSARQRLGDVDAPLALGHSLGEITALAYAGAFTAEEGLWLVTELGDIGHRQWSQRPSMLVALMGLAAVEAEWVRRLAAARTGGVLEVSGFNGPRQFVLSGDRAAAQAAFEIARGLGATVQELPIRGGYHSPLLGGMLPRWRSAVESLSWRAPRVPVLSTVDGRLRSSADELPELLVRWLLLPVRWTDATAAAAGLGVPALWDAGPGRVLRKLGKRIGLLPFTDDPREIHDAHRPV